jgi:hypothetical protein
MITVRYSDEPDPITYLSDRDRELFEAVKAETGATIREICAAARELIMADLDPIRADGARFTWPRSKEPDLWFISPIVPAPDANVCVIEALNDWQRDTRNCEWLLDHDDSVEGTVKVLKNTISWLSFWKVRARTPELRGWYAKQLEERLAGLAELRERVFENGNDEIVGALSTIDGG